jgi:hypothetical protein
MRMEHQRPAGADVDTAVSQRQQVTCSMAVSVAVDNAFTLCVNGEIKGRRRAHSATTQHRRLPRGR